MKIKNIAAAVALLGAAFAASADSTLARVDHQMVLELVRANSTEIELGKLAVARASSPQVKAFGQQMVDDHSKALEEIKQLAANKNVDLNGAALGAEFQAKRDKLAALTGAAFDKEYMANAGVGDHTKVHKELANYQKAGKDADVKALVAKLVPTVDQHMHAAQQLNATTSRVPATGAKPPDVGEPNDHSQGKPNH